MRTHGFAHMSLWRSWRRPRRAALLVLLWIGLLLGTPPVRADSGPTVPDWVCLTCHERVGIDMVLPSGEILPITVDSAVLHFSAHGQTTEQEIHCQDCHTDIVGYPHGTLPVRTYRELQIYYSQTCANCHEEEALKRVDSVHARLLASGKLEAATCVDCHGAHNVRWINREKHPEVPRIRAVEMCKTCHSTIYEAYLQSVHGRDLLEGNEDVPGCPDCHPAHTIEDPRTLAFRVKSPNLCGKCHGDKALMAKYGISTDVFDTYVGDFHGTTVLVFQKTAPGQGTNKAVCIDCHGAHKIMRPEEVGTEEYKANLLQTCRQCHPDASPNFADSWLGHYRPDWKRYPLVTAVLWFYRIVIPLTLGFFLLYIGLDAQKRLRERK
ncbi:MAG: cytochrome C [Chloroflexi bacterium]|nr:cytochrome C [Chloroflexota bacterium]